MSSPEPRRRLLWCLAALAGMWLQLAPGVEGATGQAGNVLQVSTSSTAADLTLEQGVVARVEFLADDIVRVRLNPYGSLSRVPTGAVISSAIAPTAVQFLDSPEALLMQSPRAVVAVRKQPFQVIVLRSDQSVVTEDVPGGIVWNTETGQIAIKKVAHAGEAYFGLGARGGPINRRGRVIAMHNADSPGYGEFTDPLYISIPFFYGLWNGQAYGLFFDNPADTLFDLDQGNTGVLTLGASAGEIDYYVLTGPTPADVAWAYARLTGTTPLPPKWTLGYHQSRYSYDSQELALTIARQLRHRKFPCDALWLDIDYMDGGNQFTWNPRTFPAPNALFQDLREMGFHSVAIVEPLLLDTDPLWPAAHEAGYLLRNRDGTTFVTSIWYGDVSFIDFTNLAARAWYGPLLANFLSRGIDGVWNDLNEPAQTFMPQVVYNYYGAAQPDVFARNLYALHQASLTYDTMRSLRPNQRPWAISRSGYAGIQRYAANWSGDTLSTFDSLRVSLQMTISMGLSGQNFFGHDIGGFLGSPSPELFLRWLQFGSYIPLFRTHSTKESAWREPWSFGWRHLDLIRQTLNQRYRMLPYLYSLFQQTTISGRPVIAPLFFDFPQDSNTYSQDQSFLLGPYLLVAPVVEAGAGSRLVYLPQGENWIDYYTDTVHPGGSTVLASAPLDRIPVFVREGAILPSGPVLQYVDEPVDRPLYLDFYPGSRPSSFLLYEDDGKSFDYLNGAYLSTFLTRAEQSGTIIARSQRVAGNWRPGLRAVWMSFHGVNASPSAVYAYGQLLPATDCAALKTTSSPAWCYEAAARKVTVYALDQEDFTVEIRR